MRRPRITVIPAYAGIQPKPVDPRVRGGDTPWRVDEPTVNSNYELTVATTTT
jgi:hypothetical protein